MTRVAIVRTGVANTASVAAALRRAGADPAITDDADDITSAPCLVLPGVGSFGAGMQTLRERELIDPLRERIEATRPTLAICLGMQLLCETSEESPGVKGLGIIPTSATRFAERVRTPQFGWNRVTPSPECPIITPGYAYFANSYKIDSMPSGWVGATTEHSAPFTSAMERGPVVACQFHPELSGAWGLSLITRWLACAQETTPC